jgi:hypothetical protein
VALGDRRLRSFDANIRWCIWPSPTGCTRKQNSFGAKPLPKWALQVISVFANAEPDPSVFR